MATNPENRRTDEEKTGLEKELADLRREVIESRNLVIKTDNLLKNLFAELKTVSKRNDDGYRRTWISAAAAYALFVGLAITVSLLASRGSVATERARTEQARQEAAIARKQAEDLSARLASGKAELDQQRSASARALSAFQILADGKGEERLKGIDALAGVDRNLLSELEKRALDERAGSIKVEVGEAAYERGKSAYRRQEMATAVRELTRFLALDPQGFDSIYAQFLLGTAQFQLRNWQDSARALETFVANGKGQRNVDYGLYVLGQCYEQLGNNDRAMQIYQRALKELPASEYVPSIQRRLRTLKQIASGGSPVAADPVAAPMAASAAVVAPAAPRTAPAVVPAAAPRIAPAAVPAVAPKAAPVEAPKAEPTGAPAALGSSAAVSPATSGAPIQLGAAAPE